MQLAVYDDSREGLSAVAVLIQRSDAAGEAAVVPCHRLHAPVVIVLTCRVVRQPGAFDRADVNAVYTRHIAENMARASEAFLHSPEATGSQLVSLLA